MGTTSSKFGAWLPRMIGAALLWGYAASLTVFFVDRIRGGLGTVWLWELGWCAGAGTVVEGALILVLAGLLYLLGQAAKQRVDQRWSEALARLVGLPAVLLVYLGLSVALSDNSAVWRVAGGATAALLAGAFVAWGLPRFLGRLEPIGPVLAAAIVSAVSWFAVSTLVRQRLGGEAVIALLCAAVPPLLAAGAWSLARRSGRTATGVAIFVAALFSGGWISLWAPDNPLPAGQDRPDVVFLVVDTLRADRVHGEHAAMPRIKEHAAGGISYTRAYTPIPKTQQSVSTLHTGLFPWNHGVRTLHQTLPVEQDTLAERFAHAGYRTAAFVHNPWIGYGMGHEQGFHEYYDYDRLESISPLLHSLLLFRILDNTVGPRRGAYRFQVDGRQMTEQVLKWLENAPDRPFFLWIHYFDPHWPYLPPGEAISISDEDMALTQEINGARGRFQRSVNIFHARKAGVTKEQTAAAARLYTAEATYTDQQIGRILQQLPHPKDTALVFTSDHGESLGEHDYHFHHGAFTYDVCLRVPLTVTWPGRVPAGLVVDEPVITVDIVPTLAALAGLETGEVDGRILPGIDGAAPADEDRVVPFEGDIRLFEANERIPLAGIKGKWRGVLLNQKKLIAVPQPGKTGFQYYDTARDPGETNDLGSQDPQVVRQMVEILRSTGLTLGGAEEEVTDQDTYELSEEEASRLRALGYIQ